MKSINSQRDYENLNAESRVDLTDEEQALLDEYGPLLKQMDRESFIKSLQVSATGRLSATQQGLVGMFDRLRKNPIDNRVPYLYLPGPAGDHGSGDLVNMLHLLTETREVQEQMKKAEAEESLALKLSQAGSAPSVGMVESFKTEESDYQPGGDAASVGYVPDAPTGNKFANGAKTPQARLHALNSYLKDHSGKYGMFVFNTETKKMMFDEHGEDLHRTYELMPHPQLREHMEELSSGEELFMPLPGMVHMVYKDAVNDFMAMAKKKMMDEPTGAELPGNVAAAKVNPLAHPTAKEAVASTLLSALGNDFDLSVGANVEALAEALTPDLNMAFSTSTTADRLRKKSSSDNSAAARIARLREARSADARSGAAMDAAPAAVAPSAHSLLVHTFSGLNRDPVGGQGARERVQQLGDFMGTLREKFGDDEAVRMRDQLKAETRSSLEAMGLSFEGATNMANGDVHAPAFKLRGYQLNPSKEVTMRNAAFRVAPNAKNAPKAAAFNDAHEFGFVATVTQNGVPAVHPVHRAPVTLKRGDTLYSTGLVLSGKDGSTFMIASPMEPATQAADGSMKYHSRVTVPGHSMTGHMQTADINAYDASSKIGRQDHVKTVYFN